MNATPRQIGPYKITREIGRGGMGVVYLARDERLDRDVAIKALPEELAEDPVRLERFEREAKTLATLNHPNVAGIYGVEEQDGQRYLILEYVEGETLGERLNRGHIPVDEALEIAIEIASGIEAAHEAGVIHRDLKPDNIKITPEGKVKVLDFGLAKAEKASTSTVHGDSPTVIERHSPTIPGAILGTAAYMSPEQARGRKVDKRTDIWSFGVLLYEMLTGVGPFVGETATDSIGAILHKDVDLTRLPPETPTIVRHVLGRCLDRDKNHRLHDVADARIDLELAASGDEGEAIAGTPALPLWRQIAPWGVAIAAIVAAVVIGVMPSDAPPAPERFVADIVPPDGMLLGRRLGPMALSPDGRRIAFVAYEPVGEDGDGSEDERSLLIRDLVSGNTTKLEGPERPSSPFWSPDGRWIAFFDESSLNRIDTRGGRPEVLTSIVGGTRGYGGAWSRDGVIVYSMTRGPLMKIDSNGGTPVELFDMFPERSGDWPIFPDFLPDGEHILFTNQDDQTDASGLYVGSITDGSFKRLLPFETMGRYLEPGWLVYWRAGDLHRQPFDLELLELTGESERIASGVWRMSWPVFASFSIAGEGTLAYLPEGNDVDDARLLWFDRDSGETTPLGIQGSLWSLQLSPDGTRLAFDRTVDATAGDIVVLDLERGMETMLSRDVSNESTPEWSPDGAMIYFFRGADLFSVRSNGMTEPEMVYSNPGFKAPGDVSPDGTWLVFTETFDNDSNLRLLDTATGEVSDWLNTPFNEFDAEFSPDGTWIAYTSNAPGENRIMLRSFPDGDVMVPVSVGMGVESEWAGDELFYVTRTDLVSVRIEFPEGGPPTVGSPTALLPATDLRGYTVSPDGRRILFNESVEPRRGGAIRIVKNWATDGDS